MIATLLGAWALFVGMALIMLGHGLQSSLLGLRATLEGFETVTTGLIMSSYAAGFAAGSLITPRFIARVGHVRVFAAFASTASAVALGHVVLIEPVVWWVLRFTTGVCNAGMFVIAESWLNERATNETRGRMLSAYMVVTLGGIGGGQLLLNLAPPERYELFILASVLPSVAVVPMLLAAIPAPRFDAPSRIGLGRLFAISPLGVLGCFVTGLSSGALIGMGAVYGQATGLSVAQISLFMGIALAGAVALQWPIGRLSDALDRRVVIAAVTMVAAAAALAAIPVSHVSVGGLFALICVLGGTSFPMYSLSLAHTNDRLEPEQMVSASAGLVLVTGIGGVFGPFAASALMSVAGADGFFWHFVAVHAALGAFALYRMARRPATPLDEQEPHVIVPRASPVSTALALETAREQSRAED